MSNDLISMSARDAAQAIRERRLSARELTDACLARVAERDEAIRAWHYLDPDRARAEADARDRAGAAGLLAGLPIGVKDILATAGTPTASGSPIHRDRVTPTDAACVAALRAEGGVVLGKTATTEFAAYTPTDTCNPCNPGHTPGGSSSGSAAAVADRQVPLAIGTQTAGSVIRPASFCGVVGYKPTFGTIDVAGFQPFAASLDTIGVFARDVADAGLFTAAMAGWPALAETAPRPPRRVHIVRAPAWDATEPAMRAAVERAAEIFADAGIPVAEAALPEGFDTLTDVQDRIQVFEGHRALRWEREERADLLSDDLKSHFARAAALGYDNYRQARIDQVAWQQRMDEAIAEGDVWLTASALGEAPAGLGSTGDPVFCRIWTFLHTPCVSLPGGTGPADLPLGVQLVARRHDDRGLLAASAWLEERLS